MPLPKSSPEVASRLNNVVTGCLNTNESKRSSASVACAGLAAIVVERIGITSWMCICLGMSQTKLMSDTGFRYVFRLQQAAVSYARYDQELDFSEDHV